MEPKLERILVVPGTLLVIRLTCEIGPDGRDTTAIGVTWSRTASALTTARLVVTEDERLYVLARAACVTGTPAGDRCAVLSLLGYVEAWYGEFVGQMVPRTLRQFAESPPVPS